MYCVNGTGPDFHGHPFLGVHHVFNRVVRTEVQIPDKKGFGPGRVLRRGPGARRGPSLPPSAAPVSALCPCDSRPAGSRACAAVKPANASECPR